jgi:broad specificity phosphatase PhoE
VAPTHGETTILLFVRHTDVQNPRDILYGRLPRFGLSDLGREQAEVTAAVLAEEPVTHIYTSPRLRARQTARILAQPHPDAQLHVSRLIDEVRTGWQGRPHSELDLLSFNFYEHRLLQDDETIEEVWARIGRFVRLVRRRHAGETVVAVSHGDPIFMARSFYLRMPVGIASIRRPNVYPGKGSITRLRFPAELAETYPSSLDYYAPNGNQHADEVPGVGGWYIYTGEGAQTAGDE